MELLWNGLAEALRLIAARDPQVMAAAGRSVLFSSTAIVLAAAVGLPLGVWLARVRFAGKRLVVVGFRVAMALPTVFVGTLCYALFSRQGPLGALGLLYAPGGIVAGELLLATPIIIGITHGAVGALDPRVAETARTLGAGPGRLFLTLLSDAHVPVMLAVLTAFARCVTELGIAMIVGGNIQGRTRTLASATALEISNGQFARGIAMGILLLLIALVVTSLMGWVSRDRETEPT